MINNENVKEFSLEETISFMKQIAENKKCEVSCKLKNLGSSDGIYTDSLLVVNFYNEKENFSINYEAKRYNDQVTVYLTEM